MVTVTMAGRPYLAVVFFYDSNRTWTHRSNKPEGQKRPVNGTIKYCLMVTSVDVTILTVDADVERSEM